MSKKNIFILRHKGSKFKASNLYSGSAHKAPKAPCYFGSDCVSTRSVITGTLLLTFPVGVRSNAI